MAILYALVARGTMILAEHNKAQGNADVVARRLLEKIPPAQPQQDSRVSYTQDRHIFHLLRSGGLTYMCMSEESFGRRIPFAFLDDIKAKFSSAYGKLAQTALAYAMNDEFGRVLSQQMDYFSTNPEADTINKVKGEMVEVRNVMVENIEKVLDRGERIDLLVDRTGALQCDGFRFKNQARRLKRAMWFKNVKLMTILIITLLVLLYGLLAHFCGWTIDSCSLT
ncbi:hypothetical protein CBR_g30836 [Chara braunii]|uniref:V-SNARE coiled-coil homology domain-containing protein n=1 Tax=Chara braunii TaxID=69332 RepID=A0A388JXM0_CHABU|nr:hypothetical protein CBR_g30836 [Chara braunii]|eukprot:GBG62518.1 hypothetical protein CBR_g30836 [Chara braunii]